MNFLGGLTWSSSDQRTALAFSLITGDVSNVGGIPGDPDNNRTTYSLVFSRDITDRLQYTFHHDLGVEQKATAEGKEAEWFGITQSLFYGINETLTGGLRFE